MKQMKAEQKIKWARQHMPVLESIRHDFMESKPFKGLKIGACLHMTKETAVLLLAIQDAGALEVVACASNPLSTQDDVVEYLQSKGVKTFGRKGMTETQYKNGLRIVAEARMDYVIDDGGDLTESILKYATLLAQLPKGGLEQTTTGVQRIKKMELRYPIMAVNDAETKHLFDNIYGTGQSVIDGILRATNTLLAGKTFVVAGYGNCGKGLAQRAKGMGCTVIVTEINPTRALQATMDGFKVMRMCMALFQADIVVTVTGSINVLRDFWDLKDGAIVANAGHFDVEINKQELTDRAKKVTVISDDITEYALDDSSNFPKRIYLLSDGRLVNLAAAEGHPMEVMDMSFANQILGLEYLIKNKMDKSLKAGVHEVPRMVDERVALLKAKAMGIDMDTETAEQKKYRGI